MMREHIICFDLGFKVDDRTEFYNKLVSLFGVGGTVSRNRRGEVLDFSILVDQGVLRLGSSYNTLELKLDGSDAGLIVTASQINALHDQLKAHLGIVKDYPWYIRVVNVYRI
ncbi:MAG: hypothetical protein K2K74_13980 [Lachnospiraceae bacterium]|nr:hypothetical protein [Lachnospiraceae bacterium]